MHTGLGRFIYLAGGSLIASLAMTAPAYAEDGDTQPPADAQPAAQAPAATPDQAAQGNDIVVTALRRS
jgi:hypothetical protein